MSSMKIIIQDIDRIMTWVDYHFRESDWGVVNEQLKNILVETLSDYEIITWARSTYSARENLDYWCSFVSALFIELQHRYGKDHAAMTLRGLLDNVPTQSNTTSKT